MAGQFSQIYFEHKCLAWVYYADDVTVHSWLQQYIFIHLYQEPFLNYTIILPQNLAFSRQFATSQVFLARHKTPRIRVPSKKALVAKAKKRAAKARKAIDDSEHLSLMDAIAVLRVSSYLTFIEDPLMVPQAVEVAAPNSTYELFIKTEMKNGVAVPKGRVNLPREAKPKSEDKILVFAEGRQAEEAKKAGAHIVGGPELIDAVRFMFFLPITLRLTNAVPPRLSTTGIRQPRFCVPRLSFER